MEATAHAHSDIGRVKDTNEDSFLIDTGLRLYVVADGMGGHAAGEVASEMAVHAVRDHIEAHRDVVEHFNATGQGREAVLELVETAIRVAGRAIFDAAQADDRKRGMGTTTILLLLTPTRGFIAHVGDSRVYLVREGEVFQLTEDHSLINELIRRGKLRPEDAATVPYKNAVTRAVGVYADVEVDTLDFEIAPGDDYVLCSDGLTNYLRDNTEIAEVLRAHDFVAVPQTFTQIANARGGKDNITTLIVHLASEEANGREIALKVKTLRQMPLFQHLTYKELVEILNLSEILSLSPGNAIFREGDPGESLYVVLEGQVRIMKRGVELAMLGPGGHFGEMALMDKTPRSADAVAETSARLIAVPRRPLFLLMRREKDMAVKLLWCFVQVLNSRLRATSAELQQARTEDQDIRSLFDELDDEEEPASLNPADAVEIDD